MSFPSTSDKSFRALIERHPDAVIVHRRGRVIWANAAAASLLGYPAPEALVGTNALALVSPRDRNRVLARIEALDDGSATTLPPAEETLLRRDGQEVLVEVIGMRAVLDGEPVTAVMGRDLSERRRLERQLQRAEKLAAVGALAGGVAHEINNPLTVVLDGLAELVEGLGPRDRAVDLDELLEAAQRAYDGAMKAADIVSDLALLAGGRNEQEAAIDLEALLVEARRAALSEVGAAVPVTRRGDPLPRIAGRPDTLLKLFTRLIARAAREAVAGSQIEIEARVDGHRVEVEIAGWTAAPRPTGLDPFELGDEPAALELAVAHQVVADHRGELDVLRRGGQKRVRLALPLGLPTGIFARAVSPLPDAEIPSRPSVLVVDDEPLVARALERMLREDYEVRVVGPHEVLAAVETADPDLVITDLMMPGVTGMDLIEHLDAHRPDLAERVVLMTGGAFTPRARALVESQRFPLLEKPFRREVIEQTLREALRRPVDPALRYPRAR